jgi:Fe2+ or Zn2+ uptake regulation protein
MVHTNKQILKNYLKKYKKIDPSTAFNALNIYRLSEYVRQLRAEGMDIKTIMMKNKITGKIYGKYVLNTKIK